MSRDRPELLKESPPPLSPRETKYLQMLFGLNGHEAHTLPELAAKEGISQARVQQIKDKALRRLWCVSARPRSASSWWFGSSCVHWGTWGRQARRATRRINHRKEGTMLKAKVFEIEIEFVEPCLGTDPKDPEVYADYIASKIAKNKSLTEEEAERLKAEEVKKAYEEIENVEERGTTGFQRMDDAGTPVPFVYNYWLRGFLKTALQSLQENGAVNKIPAYKTKIDRFVHVHPRRVPFILPERSRTNGNGSLEYLERPLRAMTAQGPRVTVVRSECLPEGTRMLFRVELLNNKGVTEEHIRMAFSEWGRYEGLGQWRSGGYGKFEAVSINEIPPSEQ